MTTQHTPGPWTIHDNSVIGADGYAIADLSDDGGPIYRVDGERRKVGPKSLAYLNANLHLISAAPDLLAALREALHVWHNYRIDSTETERAIEAKCRAAITKAEGK